MASLLDQLYEEDKAGIDQQEVFIELVNNMRTMRKERGLSQTAVGERMGGLTKSRVSQIESIAPVANMQIQTLADYAEAVDGFVSIAIYKRDSYPSIAQERARRAQFDDYCDSVEVELSIEPADFELNVEEFEISDVLVVS